jgi:hypothetical protein
MEAGYPAKSAGQNIQIMAQEFLQALKDPYKFSPYHQAIRSPFDYYQVLIIIMLNINYTNSV